jgi:cell fate regulator YaaT (PSP1 superfamily)
MKQVGFRQEAARLGGIGSCGRVCSTWLTDFRSVNTSAALPTVIIESTKWDNAVN